jgi:aspartyl-tRNA(Asn)/glutamyl-tRNA(Gln) amidotransferase subunit B
MAYEAVIGLECHIQLDTTTKMFCGCPVSFGADPNSNVCPVCLGLPGALPKVNARAIDASIRLGLALGCDVRRESVFARKNYFYPDMPKNYQISQYERPLCEGGALPVRVGDGVRAFPLIRIHIEEDTGKSFHPERHGDRRVSRVDFNRAGVPLLELVTEPVFRDPSDCGAFLTALRRLVRWLGISGGDMEKGQLRCDANVSLRPTGQEAFGTKTEIKNLNSIRGVEKGLAAEIVRQRGLLESGGRIEQATLLYDADRDVLAVMRSKESAHDYRYFPEPDLPLLRVAEPWIEDARTRLPELPWIRAERMAAAHGLPEYDAGVLTEQREVADYYERLVACGAPAKTASNWVMRDMLGLMKARALSIEDWAARVGPPAFATLLGHVESVGITAAAAKDVLAEMLEQGTDPDAIIARRGLRARSSDDELRPLVRQVLAEHQETVRQYLGGKTATLGFLVGQVMKKSGGQAVPQRVQEILRAELERLATGS